MSFEDIEAGYLHSNRWIPLNMFVLWASCSSQNALKTKDNITLQFSRDP